MPTGIGSKPGEASNNLNALKTGLFSSEMFEALGPPAKDGPWPPDFLAIGSRLKDRFDDLRKAGKAKQTPSQFWFRDSVTGGEGFFRTSPTATKQIYKYSIEKFRPPESPFVGRESELEELDQAWNDPNVRVFSIVAFGGTGKTEILAHWLTSMRANDFRGAEFVFGRSFQSSITYRAASADQVITNALKFFGGGAGGARNPVSRGDKLGKLVKSHRSLIVLDGIESLQYSGRTLNAPTGKVKDRGLEALLQRLLTEEPGDSSGLCTVTSRLPLIELSRHIRIYRSLNLGNLSRDAGAKLLCDLGVKGDFEEQVETSMEYGGHALALNLLGSYLSEVLDGDVTKRHLFDNVYKDPDNEHSFYAERILKAYWKWLDGDPIRQVLLQILDVMSLFNRPADSKDLHTVRRKPPIRGLTDGLCNLSEVDWRQALAKLARLRLLNQWGTAGERLVETHALVRHYFAKRVDDKARRQGHDRLFHHYLEGGVADPISSVEMVPFYRAVAHGCQAGKFKEAFAVYWQKIAKCDNFYSMRNLGTYGDELSAMSGFFSRRWDQTVGEIDGTEKGLIFGVVGFSMRALGNLKDAFQPMLLSQEAFIQCNDLQHASQIAGYISEVLWVSGLLTEDLLH